ncbi:DUF2071 domain-containing protein [Halobacillus rhizosphaerae]|uniref:YqjF family protein n=1 Tax=Halobacillus rhizosphaerae TaxID=3064889 RepID=UPI00398BB5EB
MKHHSWVMQQEWSDLFFLHWPIPEQCLSPVLPEGLKLDLYHQSAWISLVPFRISRIQPRGLPSLPLLRPFVEINVRTYVRYKEEHGVYFFSLDANHLPAVLVARKFFTLPYLLSIIRVNKNSQSIHFTSRRIHKDSPPAQFHAELTPQFPMITNQKGTLSHWLTERRNLFICRNNAIYKGSIRHKPWELNEASGTIQTNSLFDFMPSFNARVQPLIHYSRNITASIYPLERMM